MKEDMLNDLKNLSLKDSESVSTSTKDRKIWE